MLKGLCVLMAALLLGAGCGSSDGDGKSAGFCSGNGWRDTCNWLSSCSGGQFELLCSTNDDNVEAALLDAGVVLDGTTCACVIDDTDIRAVPYDDSFCLDQFDATDPDRHDKAAARVEAICGWDL